MKSAPDKGEMKKQMCEISIIVPVYNKRKYIANTVLSILRQTFQDYELLLIDDGSSDDSGLLCDKLSEADPRIRTFHTKNRGVSAARNYGISKASGKYISFIDADDTIDRTFLEKLYDSMKENDSDLAVCGYYKIKNGKKTVHEHKDYGTRNEVYEVLRQDLQCILWNKLFVRDKIKHLFDESISTCEDSIFCAWYYYDNNPKIACVDEVLYRYIVHNDGLTSTYQYRALNGIHKLLYINRQISEQITDERLKYLAIHHIYKVYYYGIYMFIFENLSKGPISREKLSVIKHVINNRKYQRIIRFILKYRMQDKKAERIGMMEFFIILFSFLKMKRAIYYISKVKKCL